MKEIAGNLGQDVKELLNESANLVTGFFKRGLCSVRAAADRWKEFAQSIGAAVGDLVRLPLLEDGPEEQPLVLEADSEPVVTITESKDAHIPSGVQMPLSQSNELIEQVDQIYQKNGYEVQDVQLKIDFMKEGQADRYQLPVLIGAGSGSLLEQMKARLDAYQEQPEKVSALFDRVPEEYRQQLQADFAPFMWENVGETGRELHDYFQWHCDVAAMEAQMEERAAMMPECDQKAYLTNAQEAISNLRTATNSPTEHRLERQQNRQEQGKRPAENAKPRQSIMMKLEKAKRDQLGQQRRQRTKVMTGKAR